MTSQSKTSANKKGRDSLVKLRAHVDSITKRLERANGLTRASIKALSSSYESLSVNGETDADLSGQINALSEHLNGLVEQTRRDVAHDLQIVMSDPRMETVSAALTKANRRLTRAETQQSEAIGEINSQIANLAGAVDERLQREVRARELAQENQKTEFEKRIGEIETNSADAVSSIGDKVVSVSESLQRQNEQLQSELAETSLNQQQDYEEHKADVARRVEALEDDQRNTIPSIERRIVTLTTRLEVLEAETSAPEDVRASAPPMPNAPQVQDEQPSPPAPDAFSPSEPMIMRTVPAPANPYETQLKETTQLAVDEETLSSYAAEELTPQTYEPQAYVPQEYTPDAHTEPPAPTSASALLPPAHAPFNTQTGAFEQAQSPPPFSDTPPPLAPALNPVRHEVPLAQQTMDAARPGVDPKAKKKNKKRKARAVKTGEKSRVSPVKAALLMSGVAVVGVFAAKSILPKFIGGDKPAPKTARQTLPKPLASVTADTQTTQQTAQAEPRVIKSVEAVGDYSQTMKAPNIGEGREKLTLEAAASKGDAIAQFQLGLSHLEAGRTADAVRLIRLAASQGQAAAQYRLGKLYETGLGVETNAKTAMQLLERSAAGGNRIAMHDLGHYYATGAVSGTSDITQAVVWFKKAAQRGVLDSQFNLGVLYQGGSGVEKNVIEAHIWYAIAGAQGDKVAAQRSVVVAREFTAEQKAQAEARIKAFTPRRINDAANGIFRNLPWTPKAKTQSSVLNSVKDAQKLLGTLGYDVGTPDGAMGPRTRNAVISFERANGLPETGKVDAALMDRLALAAGT